MSMPCRTNLLPRSIARVESSTLHWWISTGLPLASDRLTTSATTSRYIGLSNSFGMPRDVVRSFGPMNRASMPSISRIASRFLYAGSLSIPMMTMLSLWRPSRYSFVFWLGNTPSVTARVRYSPFIGCHLPVATHASMSPRSSQYGTSTPAAPASSAIAT